MVHAFDPSTKEIEAGGWISVRFEASLNYKVSSRPTRASKLAFFFLKYINSQVIHCFRKSQMGNS